MSSTPEQAVQSGLRGQPPAVAAQVHAGAGTSALARCRRGRARPRLDRCIGQYRDYQLAEVAAFVVAVAGLTVLIGLSGQISIGNGAFMAVGGYTGALLFMHLTLAADRDLDRWRRCAAARGRRDLRGRCRPAARPLPGRRDADAGGGAAVLRDPVPERARRRPGPRLLRQRARVPRRELLAAALAGLVQLRGGADRPGAAGQPGAQPGRPVLAGAAGRRGRRRPGRPQRRQAADPRVHRQRGLRRRSAACCSRSWSAPSRPACSP